MANEPEMISVPKIILEALQKDAAKWREYVARTGLQEIPIGRSSWPLDVD